MDEGCRDEYCHIEYYLPRSGKQYKLARTSAWMEIDSVRSLPPTL